MFFRWSHYHPKVFHRKFSEKLPFEKVPRSVSMCNSFGQRILNEMTCLLSLEDLRHLIYQKYLEAKLQLLVRIFTFETPCPPKNNSIWVDAPR